MRIQHGRLFPMKLPHLGGFTFLTTCNRKSNDISIKELPLFYERTLQYWFEFNEVQSQHEAMYKENDYMEQQN